MITYRTEVQIIQGTTLLNIWKGFCEWRQTSRYAGTLEKYWLYLNSDSLKTKNVLFELKNRSKSQIERVYDENQQILLIIYIQSISFSYYSFPKYAIFLLSIISLPIILMFINVMPIRIIGFVLMIVLFFLILISGIRCYKGYLTKIEEKYKNLFGKTPNEIKKLLKDVSKIDNSYKLSWMSKYIKTALIGFDEHNETIAIKNLENFFKEYEDFDKNRVKGPKNKRNFKDFCQIANILTRKLEYNYKSQITQAVIMMMITTLIIITIAMMMN